jgi:hypothetical protein
MFYPVEQRQFLLAGDCSSVLLTPPPSRSQVAGRACSRIKVVLRCLHPPIHPPNGHTQLLSLDRPCCRSRLEPTQEKYRVQTNSQLKLQAAQPRAGQGRAVHASPCQSMPVHNFFSWARIFTNSTEPSSLHINTGRFTDPTAIFPITPSSFPSTLLLCLFSSYTVPTVNSSLPYCLLSRRVYLRPCCSSPLTHNQ